MILRKIKIMRWLMVITTLFVVVSSCVRYKTHQYPEANEKDYHVDFYTKSGKDQLRYAKQFAGEGDYKAAVELFLKIYENTEIDSTIRQEALLNVGSIYVNVLYVESDYQKALYYLEKLLQEFPGTELRSKAVESIENIKKLLHQN